VGQVANLRADCQSALGRDGILPHNEKEQEMSSTAANFGPLAASGRENLRLAMQRLWLTGRILPAGAHLTVQHVFRSDEEKPLEVIYSFPLPRDAALRSFRISGEGFDVHSELMEREAAVRAYERGIAEGSLAALARQYGDGVVNLTVGNVRPHETVTVHLEMLAGVESRDDGFRFRFPFTLAPAYHKALKVARISEDEAEMELPASEFGDMLLPPFRRNADSLHEVGFDLSVLHQLAIDEIGSPSHTIRVKSDGAAPARVSLAAEKDVPNRDLVLDVRFKEIAPRVLAGETSQGVRSFAAIVPSTLFGTRPKTARRTVIVLDRSASMRGAAIEQARKAIEACLAALGPDDSFGLVAFSNTVESLHSTLQPASSENREDARAFLRNVKAEGGTELAAGFEAAARMLNDAGGDILILTDGQVAGTEQILAQARATNIRLFCLGIGSASQDRFLSLLARETGGVSRFVTPRERVDLPAVDLFAAMGPPAASGLKTTANVQPEPASMVFAGSPVSLFGEMNASSEALDLTWDDGQMSIAIPTGDPHTGHTIRLLQGSRLITDWECRFPAKDALAPLEKRKQSRVAERLAYLSRTYGLASREMSLVAVVARVGDQSGEIPETSVVPVGMPQDVQFDAYLAPAPPLPPGFAALIREMPKAVYTPKPEVRRSRGMDALLGRFRKSPPKSFHTTPESSDDVLINLVSQLEPDGGMPGKNVAERAARSAAVLLALVAAGHTLKTGAFRSHVERLVHYLTALNDKIFDLAIQAAKTGEVPPGDWLATARDSGVPLMTEVEKALKS
jgi:Ca-activated chloride channel family protein